MTTQTLDGDARIRAPRGEPPSLWYVCVSCPPAMRKGSKLDYLKQRGYLFLLMFSLMTETEVLGGPSFANPHKHERGRRAA